MRDVATRHLWLASRHDLLSTGLAVAVAPGWRVMREAVRRGDPRPGVIVVDVDDPVVLEVLTHDHGKPVVGWTEGAVQPRPEGATVDRWLRKTARVSDVLALLDALVPPECVDESDQLSDRERQVLQGLVDGRTNDDLAHLLYLSTNTIKTHVRNVLRKTGSAGRSGAVVWAMLHGMRPSTDHVLHR